MTGQAIHSLVAKLLDDEDKNAQQQALDALVTAAERATPALLAAFEDETLTTSQHHRLALALGRIGAPGLIEHLLTSTQPDTTQQLHVATVLDEVTNPAAVDVLLRHLHTPDVTQRQLIAGALGRTRDTRAVGALAGLLKDDSLWVRRSAAWALGNLLTAEATDALLVALQDSDPQTRIIAITALRVRDPGQVAAPLAHCLTDSELQVRKEASAALVHLGTDARSAVEPLMQHPSRETRETAILVLRWVSDRSGVPTLLQALKDESAYVRNQAARALGRLRDATAIQPLRVLRQKDPDNRIRQTAEISLRKLGAPPEEQTDD